MNNKKTTISSDDLIAANLDATFVGAIVYWRLSGNINPNALQSAWTTAGLDSKLLPKLPTPAVSLTRAVDDVAKRGRLKTRVKDGGYALLDKREKDGLSIEVNCRIYLDAKNDLRIAEQVPGFGGALRWSDCETHPLLKSLLASFEAHKGTYESRDVTSWLCNDVMHTLGATTLRKDGGVYFVPRDQIKTLGTIVEVLNGISLHKVYQVKAMTGDDAVEAVFDAMFAEAESAADAVEKAIAQGHGDVEEDSPETTALGHRALMSRSNDCIVMIEKVRKYEALLGKAMPTITDRLDSLKVAAMEASLAAKEAAKPKAAASSGDAPPSLSLISA